MTTGVWWWVGTEFDYSSQSQIDSDIATIKGLDFTTVEICDMDLIGGRGSTCLPWVLNAADSDGMGVVVCVMGSYGDDHVDLFSSSYLQSINAIVTNHQSFKGLLVDEYQWNQQNSHLSWMSESSYDSLLREYIKPGTQYTIQYDEPANYEGVGLAASSAVIPSFYDYSDQGTTWVSTISGEGATCYVGWQFNLNGVVPPVSTLQAQVTAALSLGRITSFQYYAWRRGGSSWGVDSGIAYESGTWSAFKQMNDKVLSY